MIPQISHVARRMMSTGPTSHFITLSNRPIVQTDGKVDRGPLKLHYWEWQGRRPTILFCHAASFHGRCYDQIINEALYGFHVIALDFRGHGRSQTHPPPYRFRWLADDTLNFIEALDLSKNNLIGIGHSVGGYALTSAAAQASKRLFRSLLLLDPVIFSPSMYLESEGASFNTDYIRRRKSQSLSVDTMISRLEKREPFSRWPPTVLRNYCTYALDENNNLVCAPDAEASIYESSTQRDANIYPLIEKSKFINDIPIHVVRASTNLPGKTLDLSPTYADLFKSFKKASDMEFENIRHLFPMENPEIANDIVKKFMKETDNLFSHL